MNCFCHFFDSLVCWFVGFWPSVVIHDFHIGGSIRTLGPFETDPPSVVDPNTPLALSVATEGFQPAAGGLELFCKEKRRLTPFYSNHMVKKHPHIRGNALAQGQATPVPGLTGERSPPVSRWGDRSSFPRKLIYCILMTLGDTNCMIWITRIITNQ